MTKDWKTYWLTALNVTFNWKACCFFCGEEAHVDLRHDDVSIYSVRTLKMQEKVMS